MTETKTERETERQSEEDEEEERGRGRELACVSVCVRVDEGLGEGRHAAALRVLAGRLQQLGRQYGGQLRECREALEEEVGGLEVEDEGIKQLIVTVQSLR